MPRIFISYRRDDSAAHAGRLYDRLIDHFDQQSVFMDVDTIQPSLSPKSGLLGYQLPRPNLFFLFLYAASPTLKLQNGNCFRLTVA